MTYKVFYWPVPFRGNFIRLLLEDAEQKYKEADSKEIIALKTKLPNEQPAPIMAPPFFEDLEANVFLGQMPVIMDYLATKLGYKPSDPHHAAIALKLILDSNDILMEITNLNGNSMWEHDSWKEFRSKRLPRWMHIFEETAAKFGLNQNSSFFFGGGQITVADITVYALWGTMTRCLTDLKIDLETNAPNIAALCSRLERRKKIQDFLIEQQNKWGNLYCGGQIERSIRSMLELDKREEKE